MSAQKFLRRACNRAHAAVELLLLSGSMIAYHNILLAYAFLITFWEYEAMSADGRYAATMLHVPALKFVAAGLPCVPLFRAPHFRAWRSSH